MAQPVSMGKIHFRYTSSQCVFQKYLEAAPSEVDVVANVTENTHRGILGHVAARTVPVAMWRPTR